MRRRNIVLGIGILVGVQLAALGLYVLVRKPPPQTPFAVEILSAREAPPLTFRYADGSSGTLASLRGKVVMVHFWGTWCEPCRDELPGLLALASKLDDRLVLIAVSVDDEWDDIRKFFAGSIPRSIVVPDAAAVHRSFGASTLPDSYLVDGHGNIVLRYAGARDWRRAGARAHLESAIVDHGRRR